VSVGAARFAYDRDGNLTRQVTGTTRQLYDWDPLSQLASVTSYQPGRAAQETSFAYDNASGDRLIRRDPDGTVTLYLPGTDLTDQDGQVTATRYYSISGTTIGTRTAGPGSTVSVLGWLAGNPQGSPQYAIDSSTGAPSGRQRYLPYGALNGARTIKVTDRAFQGQPLDDSTGLIADGPATTTRLPACFISPDPILSSGTPASAATWRALPIFTWV
jgi:YD repeat-containing protein